MTTQRATRYRPVAGRVSNEKAGASVSYHTNPQPQGQFLRGYQKPPGYPHYPSPPPPKPYRRVPLWLIALIVGAIAVVFAAAVSAVDPDEPAVEDAPEGVAAGGQDVYAIGQTAHSGDADLTVHTVTDPYTPTNQFEVPEPGHRLVAVEATITNPTDQLVTWSSLLQSELTDAQGRRWDIAFAGSDLPRLEGDIPIQGLIRGWVVFAVASDATGLQIRIKGNITATGSLFQLT